MPPMEGSLAADFSEFEGECAKADTALAGMQSEADKTSASLTNTASSMDKMKPATDKASNGFTELSTGLKAADKTLGAFGVQIGPQISALEELGQVSGKTASQLGAVGTAAAVAGAAVAGWNIGRWIADMTGSDKKIGDFTASLLGWGKASDEVAKNNAAVLQRAFEKTGQVFTDVYAASEALRASSKANAEQFNTAAARVAEWEGQLSKAKAGGLSALRAEIESGNSTVQEMATHYGISTRAVEYLTKQMGEETKARKESEQEARKQADAQTELNEVLKGSAAQYATLTAAEINQIENALKLGAAQKTIADAWGFTAQQVKAVADALKDEQDALKKYEAAQKVVSDATAEHYADRRNQLATTTQAEINAIDQWKATQLQALQDTGGAFDQVYSDIERIAQEKLAAAGINWDDLKDTQQATLDDAAARAERTYQYALESSGKFSTGAIEHLRQLSIAAKTAAASVGDIGANYADQAQTIAKAGADADANLAKQIEYAQKWGVSLQQAADALGISSDQAAASVKKSTQGMREGTDAANQYAIAMVDAGYKIRDAWEEIAAGNYLMEQYNKTGVAMGQQIATGGYTFQQLKDVGVKPTYGLAQPWDTSTPWGRQGGSQTTNTLNVNVNSTDAQNIADKLMTEMRHSGYRM